MYDLTKKAPFNEKWNQFFMPETVSLQSIPHLDSFYNNFDRSIPSYTIWSKSHLIILDKPGRKKKGFWKRRESFIPSLPIS